MINVGKNDIKNIVRVSEMFDLDSFQNFADKYANFDVTYNLKNDSNQNLA